MKDIRLISIDKKGNVELTPELMHIPLTDREAAIQRIVICLINTPGTMVDAPYWGGGSLRLHMQNRKKFTVPKEDVGNVIHSLNNSLEKTEVPGSPYSIKQVILIDISRDTSRGYSVKLRVDFEEAISEKITIPGMSDVNI